ncbi:MAG: TolC family protein, partial [Rhodospirillaceae bacterium]|nr:TolC family protein [Rhodospirillaceae bacterium]
MKLEAQSLRRALLLGTAFLTGIAGFAAAASAMTLQEAVGLIISTNPEVGVTVKDRRAIDYELRQARALYYPQIDIRLDAGIDFSENETTDTGNARTNQGVHDHGRWLYGRRDAQVTLQQRIFDGFETDSEVERQKQRIASAGQRVQDQGQVSALDGTQVYLDVLRHTERVANAEENVKAHEETLRWCSAAPNSAAA